MTLEIDMGAYCTIIARFKSNTQMAQLYFVHPIALT